MLIIVSSDTLYYLSNVIDNELTKLSSWLAITKYTIDIDTCR